MRYGAIEMTTIIIYNKGYLRPGPDPPEKARRKKRKKRLFFIACHGNRKKRKINVTRQVER